MFKVPRADIAGTRRETFLSHIASSFADPEVAMARLVAPQNGAFVLCEDIALKDGSVVRWSASPVEIPGGFVQIVKVA